MRAGGLTHGRVVSRRGTPNGRRRTKGARASSTRKRALPRLLRILRAHLPELAPRYHIKSLGVFGSYVRHDQTPKSDLDLLVEFDDDNHLTLLGYVHLENELSDLLGVKVDLVEKKAVKPRILENIAKVVEV